MRVTRTFHEVFLEEMKALMESYLEVWPEAEAVVVVESEGTVDDLLKWLRKEGKAHAKFWILKHSGIPKAGRYLTELKRLKKLEWHETLYETSTGMRTMTAAFVDGALPPTTTPTQDQAKVLAFVKRNPGNSTKNVEGYCGVVKSAAEKALNKLLARGEIEMRQDPDDSSCYKVWPVE